MSTPKNDEAPTVGAVEASKSSNLSSAKNSLAQNTSFDKNGVPIVDCVFTKPNELSFFCPHCRTRHFHGAAGFGASLKIGSLAGHRVAHCHDLASYPRGYYLRVSEIRDRAIAGRAFASRKPIFAMPFTTVLQ